MPRKRVKPSASRAPVPKKEAMPKKEAVKVPKKEAMPPKGVVKVPKKEAMPPKVPKKEAAVGMVFFAPVEPKLSDPEQSLSDSEQSQRGAVLRYLAIEGANSLKTLAFLRDDSATPKSVRLRAAVALADRAGFVPVSASSRSRSPSEMSSEALHAAIAKLTRVASDRAQVVESAPEKPSDPLHLHSFD